MTKRDKGIADSPLEADRTVIDEALKRELRERLRHEGTQPGYADPQPFPVDESDGQETMVWEGALVADELLPEHSAPPSLDSQERAEEPTTALGSAEMEELALDAPQASSLSYVDPRAWFLGRSLGGFRVVCELASGGMATVFLARKEGPARVAKHAALKVVHPHLAFEREFVDMFLDEARIAACVHHANVCRVLDFGMAEGTYYLAMEYLLGETWSNVRLALADHPDGRRMLPVIAAHVIAQACEGLHAAHEAADDEGRQLHIVHRDISPQNIFVAYDGTVRVLDFGIARAADRITSTRDGMLKGRLAYMSPEQMANEPITRAADIWSIGVVLREALEGKRLFRRGTDAETMFAVTSEPMPAWSVEVPEKLQRVVERALMRDPAARYMSAHDMALDLSRFVASELRPINSSELSHWMQRLFAGQIEQKRALLQLPIPEPQGGPAPIPAPQPTFTRVELKSGTATVDGFEPLEEVRPRRRARMRWVNMPAVIALATLGVTAGLFLGRYIKGRGAGAPATADLQERPTEPQPQPSPPLPLPAAPDSRPSLPEPYVAGQAPEAAPDRRTQAQMQDRAPPPVQGAEQSARERPTPEAARADESVRREERRRRAAERAASAETRATRASEAVEAPTTAEGPPGTVLVSFNDGWAEVYLGDKLLGTTPGRFSVPSGKPTLTIKPFGTGTPIKKRVEVKPGEVTKLFVAE